MFATGQVLSDEIYVLSPRPGRIKARIEVPLPRPRQRDCFASPLFIDLKARCLDLLFDNAATTQPVHENYLNKK